MPVAMGIEETTSRLDKATIASGSPRREACPNTDTQTSDRAEAEANHLICWRSSSLARRKRTNSEITAPSPARKIMGTARLNSQPNTAERHSSTSDAKPPGRTNAGPRSGQRTMEVSTQIRPMERPPSQPTGRQRRDGGRGGGKRRGKNTRIRPSPGAQIQFASKDNSAPNGSEPGFGRSARIGDSPTAIH